jgi:hypothetical protein
MSIDAAARHRGFILNAFDRFLSFFARLRVSQFIHYHCIYSRVFVNEGQPIIKLEDEVSWFLFVFFPASVTT